MTLRSDDPSAGILGPFHLFKRIASQIGDLDLVAGSNQVPPIFGLKNNGNRLQVQ